MSDVKPGKYMATIVDADIWKDKKGLPIAVIRFEFQVDELGNQRQLSWMGSLNGGAREITVDTLVRCGFESNSLVDLTNGVSALKPGPYEIVVEMNSYEGKTTPRIQYINLPGGAGFREKMTREEAVQVCGGMNLNADFMQARMKVGKPRGTAQIPMPNSGPAGLGNTQTEEDLPF